MKIFITVLALLSLMVMPVGYAEPTAEPVTVTEAIAVTEPEAPCPYEYLTDTCNRYGVEADNMLALIKIESDFNPNLISRTNDWGLCQINVCNHERLKKELGITDFLDPYQSIECGVFLIAELENKYKEADFNKTLMRYNLGETGAKRLFNKGIYETHYTKKHAIALERSDWGW